MDSKRLKEINKIISDIKAKCSDGNYIFRGTPEQWSTKKEGDGISSSLYRAYEKVKVDNDNIEALMVNIERRRIEDAGKYFQSNLLSVFTNNETLTELRHFGSSLNLIDFSKDLYIALFFACYGDFGKPGELILLNTDNIEKTNSVEYNNSKPSIRVIEAFQKGHNSKTRVMIQKSVFVYAPRGYILKKECEEPYKIEAKHKRDILEYLEKFHNINHDMVYNDFVGFINNQEKSVKAVEHLLKALRFREANKHLQAITELDKAIDIQPSFSEAYNNRGLAKDTLGKHQEAIKDYSQATKIKPNLAMAHFNRGISNGKLGNHEEAIEDYTEAIRINPNDAVAYNNRGFAKDKLRRYEEAIEDYNHAIRIDPRFALAHSNKGEALYRLGRYNEAITDWEKAIRLDAKYEKKLRRFIKPAQIKLGGQP